MPSLDLRPIVLVGDFNKTPFSAGRHALEPDTMVKKTLGKLGMDDIERIENALGTVREEMKELREAVVGLVRVDEKVSNLIKISETNTESISQLSQAVWKRVGSINSEISEIKQNQAAKSAVDDVYGKLAWKIYGGVVSIIVAIVAAALLT